MRPIYLFFRITLIYLLKVFFKRGKGQNAQQKFNAQTIFVSNHPSAFLDPFLVGNYQKPIIFILTRGDVFKKWLKPVTWATHMIPIYRKEEDGADSMQKNESVFKGVEKMLLKKKCVLFFGEGYTDNVFIRSLKPIKKGPARIGFQTMESSNWQADLKIQTVGLNYADPKRVRSDIFVAYGKIIHLKDYKEVYEENPNRAITLITKEIESDLQSQLTYVENKELAPFVENIMKITRKGMNHENHDDSIPLKKRYEYSKALATKINENFTEENEGLNKLKKKLEDYFNNLKKNNLDENWIYNFSKSESKNTLSRILFLILALPIALVGIVHCFIPYILIKKLVEKMFKRDVFWSGVKLFLGAFAITLYNIPAIFLFHNYVFESYWLGFLYFLIVPASTGIIAHFYVRRFKNLMRYTKVNVKKLKEFKTQRDTLKSDIQTLNL